jgi:hypothetical protein
MDSTSTATLDPVAKAKMKAKSDWVRRTSYIQLPPKEPMRRMSTVVRAPTDSSSKHDHIILYDASRDPRVLE